MANLLLPGAISETPAGVVINARFRGHTMTGVQRVASEISRRLSIPHRFVEPASAAEGLGGHLWEQLRLPALAGEELLWSPCNTGPLWVRRQVVTIHDASSLDHPEWFSRNFASFYRRLLPALARRAAKLVTVSAFSRERLARHFGLDPRNIAVVPNGVNENFHPRSAAEIQIAKTSLGLQGRRYFVALGTWEPRKNFDLVLRAWALARERLPPDTCLLIVGKAGAHRIFRQGVGPAEQDRVVQSGYVPDEQLPALLSGAEALLYPSLYEGFGLPLLEAMACGTPVITTALTSLPEVGGDAVRYVDPTDAMQTADAMFELASSAEFRAELAGRGIERARQFSWSSAAAAMDAILLSML